MNASVAEKNKVAYAKVFLVGVGPGDPGLLTMRAKELIERADVILYDRLIPKEALQYASEHVELIYVGKEGGKPSTPQSKIERLLVKCAQDGKIVVRLKGGDSLMFARGGEEALTLSKAGIPFEIVPGITAGIAASAYAGIPITHRNLASSVAFITGNEDPSKTEPDLDWNALANFPGTLVFYMGVKTLPVIAQRLIAAGRDRSEEVAIIENGTLPQQRNVIGSLHNIADIADKQRIKAPAITVIGPVVNLNSEIDWIAQRPLQGKRIVVTRARPQASELARTFRELGAEVIEAPAIRINSIKAQLPKLQKYDLICFTSPTGVSEFFNLLSDYNLDARALAAKIVAAIGPGTAAALQKQGIHADLVPKRAVAEGLVEALDGIAAQSALIVRGREGRTLLLDSLRNNGIEVDLLILYETLPEQLNQQQIEKIKESDYITFTSASTAKSLAESLGDEYLKLGVQNQHNGSTHLTKPKIVSIGPATSQALREVRLLPDIEAEIHTPDGLVKALIQYS